MYAMIVFDRGDYQMFIPHDDKGKVSLVHSDADGHTFVENNYSDCILMGTFPDPTEYVDIVVKEDKLRKAVKKKKGKGKPD